MLQRLGEIVYNRHRARLRRRRDPVRELTGRPSPVPAPRGRVVSKLQDAEAFLLDVDRHMNRLPSRVEAYTTACLIAALVTMGGVGVYAGVQLEDRHQEERIEAQIRRTDTEVAALSDAYAVAYESEMEDRGFSEAEIEHGRYDSIAQFVGGEDEIRRGWPVPQERDTLELAAWLKEADARRAALLDALGTDR